MRFGSRFAARDRFVAPTMAVALLLAGCPWLTHPARGNDPEPASAYRIALAEAVRSAARQVLPSVVTVEVVGAGDGRVGEVRQEASTSGVVIDEDGYILASSIAVKSPAASLLVVMGDGSRHAATAVAQDHRRDLVLLKIEPPEGLRPIRFPDQVDETIGVTVVAVGRYGPQATPILSSGILSGIGRLDGIAYQTDARVSPPFYGGPLVTLDGRLLGIMIAAVAEGGAPDETSWYDSGIAFAIPATVIAAKLDRLKRGQAIRRGLIGIVAKTSDPYDDDTTIAAVRARSPAEAAGIEAGDRVVAVASTPVRRHQQIKQAIGPYDAGDTIEVEVERDGQPVSLEVTLAETIPPLEPQRLGVVVARHVDVGSPDESLSVPTTDASAAQDASDTGPNGQPPDAVRAGRDGSVVVRHVLPGSPADGRLRPGDRIDRLSGSEIRDPRTLRRLLVAAEPQTPLSIQGRRDGSEFETEIGPVPVAGKLQAVLPDGFAEQVPATWTVEEFSLPDAANPAALLRPGAGDEGQNGDENDQAVAVQASGVTLGLLVYLLNPGQGNPAESLAAWQEAAEGSGVAVLAIAPEDNSRWQAQEIEVIGRMVAAVRKRLPIDASAVAIAAGGGLATGSAEAGDSMALAVAMTESRTFAGVAVSDKTRPPMIRIRENDPAAPLQLLLPIGSDEELPSWAKPLVGRGYPIVRGEAASRETLLRWTWCLQAI